MTDWIIVDPITQSRDLALTACVGFLKVEGEPDKLIVIKNNRGWDIPGGHIESGEKPYEAFKREVLEESGCDLLEAEPLTLLVSTQNQHAGILVYKGTCEWGKFASTDEVSEVRLMAHDEFLAAYFGDKVKMGELLDLYVGATNRA